MSRKNLSNSPDAEKEDAVREALGVEKKFIVNVGIPTVGVVHLKPVTVMAIDSGEAEAKAKELALSGEIDAAGEESEEHRHDYDYAPSPEWVYEVNEAD